MKSMFFDYDGTEDTQYSAVDFRKAYSSMLSDGVIVPPNDDITTSTACKVVSDGGNVKISAGVAVIKGAFAFMNDDIVTLTVNGSYRIVLEYSEPANKISAKAILSTESLIRTATVYQIQLATVSREAGIATVTDTRADKAVCGYVNKYIDPTLQEVTSRITANENSISTMVIGGRNLLLNSNFNNGLTNWTVTNASLFTDTIKGNCLKIEGNINTTAYYVRQIYVCNDAIKNNSFVIQAKYKRQSLVLGTVSPKVTLYVIARLANGTSRFYENFIYDGTDTDWQTKIIYIEKDLNITQIEVLGYCKALSGYILYDEFKLETGTIATDWSPAPEDVDDKINTLWKVIYPVGSLYKTVLNTSNPTIIFGGTWSLIGTLTELGKTVYVWERTA